MDKPLTQTNRVVVAKVKNILSDIGSSKDMLKDMFTKSEKDAEDEEMKDAERKASLNDSKKNHLA